MTMQRIKKTINDYCKRMSSMLDEMVQAARSSANSANSCKPNGWYGVSVNAHWRFSWASQWPRTTLPPPREGAAHRKKPLIRAKLLALVFVGRLQCIVGSEADCAEIVPIFAQAAHLWPHDKLAESTRLIVNVACECAPIWSSAFD